MFDTFNENPWSIIIHYETLKVRKNTPLFQITVGMLWLLHLTILAVHPMAAQEAIVDPWYPGEEAGIDTSKYIDDIFNL